MLKLDKFLPIKNQELYLIIRATLDLACIILRVRTVCFLCNNYNQLKIYIIKIALIEHPDY